jgi:AraC-like DNA-binding protein
MDALSDGSYRFHDEIEFSGNGTSNFVFGRGWLVEIVDLSRGDYYFISDGSEVRPSAHHFGIFYPRFTMVCAGVNAMKGIVSGIGSIRQPFGLPGSPFIFETDHRGEFNSIDDAVSMIHRSRDRKTIEINTRPSLLSVKTKRLIDENFEVYPSIARIAARLRVTHAHLSRQFRKDFGLSPSSYLHQLRVAEATLLLSLGQEIVDISQVVGYNDLSRFYKQFRKQYATSPGRCRTAKFDEN